MKRILISVHEEHVKDIIEKKKIFELRSWKPNDIPCIVYVCQISKDNKERKVYCSFTLRKVHTIIESQLLYNHMYQNYILRNSCVSFEQARPYLFKSSCKGFAWFITNLYVFDTPVPLSQFNIKAAPQKFRYLHKLIN